jgi:hypothetical protein
LYRNCQGKAYFMRTAKLIAASRENGRTSHGAATPEGKARIVAANLDTGIFAETQVLTWEHESDLTELRNEYYARHPPASPEARCLLDQIVTCEWHLRRFAEVEGALWDQLSRDGSSECDPCAYALRHGDQTFRGRAGLRLPRSKPAEQQCVKDSGVRLAGAGDVSV